MRQALSTVRRSSSMAASATSTTLCFRNLSVTSKKPDRKAIDATLVRIEPGSVDAVGYATCIEKQWGALSICRWLESGLSESADLPMVIGVISGMREFIGGGAI